MIPKSLNIFQKQEDWLVDNSINFSRYVRKKIDEDIEKSKDTTSRHGECTVTYGDGD